MTDAAEPSPSNASYRAEFYRCWIASTTDRNLTLYGFRRFKTTYLLNLRLLEKEIADIDHIIYQAGLSLSHSPSSIDRLGLKYCKRDDNAPDIDDVINQKFILKLRGLLRQYSTLKIRN
jgi:hypothetical protein